MSKWCGRELDTSYSKTHIERINGLSVGLERAFGERVAEML